jgi:hypothetical protein
MKRMPLKTISGRGFEGTINLDGSLLARAIAMEATVQSAAYARIIDLVSEGEIEGLVDGMRSIYLDGTPLQNQDGTFNFQGIQIDVRNGTPFQPYVPHLPGTENTVTVGAEVKASSPIVRTISNPDVDHARITISLPSLCITDQTTGALNGYFADIRIDVQSNGGGFQTVVADEILGKSTSKYQRSYTIPLTGGAPYDVRVVRVSPDETSQYISNRTFWESYTEIEQVKLRYPNSAIVSVIAQAAQFSQIPSRAYDMKLLRIQVPTNYDPVAKTYTGTWDGTFNVAWSDNPAWVFYDLMTNKRYGLGAYLSSDQVDKWSLYSIGQYCDELVDDGFGGSEPRFTCNLYLQSRAEAFKVMNDLASIFRGMIYWSGGQLAAVQDSPSDPVYLFSPANVVDGLFTYQGASQKARHTVALVTWNDPAYLYSQKVEYVEDADAVAQFGIIETQITAMGCTSRGQAHRLGRYTLLTERYQSETCTFSTGLEGAMLAPGHVIQISDPVRAGKRMGGRIAAVDSLSLTADSDLAISFDPTAQIAVMLPDGTMQSVQVTNIIGRQVFVAAWPTQPVVGAIWLLSIISLEPQLFKVLQSVEQDNGTYQVTAIAHNPSKYDAIDFGTVLETRATTQLRIVPDAPIDLLVTETLYAVGKDVRVKVTCSWASVPAAISYLVSYKVDNNNTVSLSVDSNEIEVLNAEPGEYTFYVTSLSAIGIRSPVATVTKKILGKAAPPADVQNFSLIPSNGFALLSWDQSTDLDVLIGGSVRIRYTPDTLTPLWRNAVDICPGLAGTATSAQAPLLSGTYMAKFVDADSNSSLDEAILITTVPAALAPNQIVTLTESPTFAGTRIAMEYRPDLGGLALSATTLVDSLPDIDSVPSWDYAGGVSATGEYDFATVVDLGASFTSRVTAAIAASTFDVSDTVDFRLSNIDDWQDIDGALIDDANATLYVRTTDDDPAGVSPNWSAWKPFMVADYKARGLQFKIIVTTESAYHNMSITQLAVTVDMPDRTINMPGLVSGTSSYGVVYEAPFYAVPAIGITIHNAASGDYYAISSKTNSGFTITFYNSSGTIVNRTFDVLSKGYGRSA